MNLFTDIIQQVREFLTTDNVNSIIECISIFLQFVNIRRILLDRDVKGVSLVSLLWGWSYGVWFTFLCKNTNLTLSFYLSTFYVFVNLTFVSLMIYYKFKNKISTT